ncbi:MAG TPA: glycosyltransferase, partial [Chthoniobacterales bacterium]|nr:glycosyltransferase [Chthoniobacterales bacterium]
MSNSPISVCFYCADQNTHRDRSRGITRYTLGLMSHLGQIDRLRLSAVASKSSIEIPEGIQRVVLPFRSDHLLGRLAIDHLHPILTRGQKPDIWHYPKGFLPAITRVHGKKVGTIADVMIQHDADHHPRSRPRLAWAYWIGMLKHSIQNFDHIITISEFSRRAILEFCD